MVFQDFDHISERRKAERAQKFRKRVTIAAIIAFVLIILIAAGVYAIVTQNNDNSTESSAKNSPTPKNVSQAKMIQTICKSTTYKSLCNETLSKAAKKDPSIDEPKEFLKASILATVDEIEKALKTAGSRDLKTPEKQAEFKVCKKVMKDAKDELKLAASNIAPGNDLGMLAMKASEFNNWLSAVMSYQQTCVDAFPQEDSRLDMEKVLNSTKQLTSNSLAMLHHFSNYLNSVMEPAGPNNNRRLLEANLESLGQHELPSWISHEEKRVLEGDEDFEVKPDIKVAKDGSGEFKTISEALAAIPKKRQGRYVISVGPGDYEETVVVTKEMANLTIVGDGPQKTVIAGSKNVADGTNMYDTATFVGIGEGLLVKAIGFRNTAGAEKRQAVAARVQSDRALFLNCRFEGWQNALWAQAHRQFYRNCLITGTVDFIFGDAAAVFQKCQIMVRKPLDSQNNVVTAQTRNDKFETTGFVLHNCRIAPEENFEPVKDKFKTYLGRPRTQYSRTIVMESTIEDLIHPEGWLAFKGDYATKTLFYGEYKNKGPRASTDTRVKWPGCKVMDKEEAMKYTVGSFLQGDWINKTRAPVKMGFFE